MRTLDHRGAAQPEVLSPGGTQPGDPRVAGATERASFPQAGRIAVQSVSQPGETGSDSVTGRALRHESVDTGHRWARIAITTLPSMRTSTACPTPWCSSSWKSAPLRPRWRSFIEHPDRFHLRDHRRGQVVTQNEHRPKSHQAHLQWTPSRMANWARTIGPNTARLFERILNAKPHPEMGYRSCLGIIRLPQQYSAQRVEAAAERALLPVAIRA